MMGQIKESDWKILRQVHSEVLERSCEQILSEVERINSDRTKCFDEKYAVILCELCALASLRERGLRLWASGLEMVLENGQ